MADNLRDVKKQIDALVKQYEKLEGKKITPADPKSLAEANTQLELMEGIISRAQARAEELDTGFKGIYETLENIVGEIGKQEDRTKKALKPLRSSQDIARKMRNDQEGISRLSVKELKQLKKKNEENKAEASYQAQQLAKEKGIVDLSKTNLKFRRDLTENELELLRAEQDSFSTLQESNDEIEKRLQKERKIQKTLGLTGAAFKGISGTLSKIGIESDAISNIQEDMYQTAEKTGSGFSVAKTAVSGIASSLKEGLLNDPLIQIALFTKVFSSLINVGASVSEKTAEIARSMGVNSDQAKDFYNNIKASALASSETAATVKSMLEANQQLNESLGTSVVFNQQQLATQTALTQRAGLQAEEAAKIAEFSLLTGQSQEDIYDSVGAINKGVLSNRKVLAETLNVNGQLAAQYRNQPTAIAQAVTQAQKLGMTLEQTQNVSRGLLDFESSISAELEAELLTGKNLNFERARSLALQGKSAEAAAEIRKQVGSLADFQKLNVIQQESIAKAAGMTADELANSLIKEQQLNTLAKSKGISYSEQVELDKQRLDAMSSISNSVSNIKSTFQSIVAGPLASMLEGVADVFNKIESNPIMRGIIKFLGAGVSIAGAIGSVMLLGRTLVNSFKGRPSGRSGDEVNVRDVSGGGGMGNDLTGVASSLAGGKKASVGKQLKKLTTRQGRKVLSRALTRKGLKGGLGRQLLGSTAGAVASKTGLKSVAKTGGKLLGGAKTIAGKAAGGISKVASKAGGKGLAKLGAKTLGKSLLKKIPGLGLLAGVGFGLQRALKGDLAGAALELASGAASTLPGLGTAASVGLDAALAARDIKQANSSPTAMATGGIVTQPTNALVGEAGAEAVIPLNEFYKKFDELINVVKSGGNVYLDGNKVGTVLSMVPVKA